MIIGVTGTNGSGKDTAAEYLAAEGFMHYSLSDILRDEAKKRNLPSERKILIDIGNELRGEHGENVLAAMTLEKISRQKASNAVITSIRNPGEISELKKSGDFFLLGVDANPEIRYKRVIARERLEERKMSFQEFVKIDEIENSKDSKKQQINLCLEMADKIIITEFSLEEFHKEIDSWVSNLKQNLKQNIN